MNIDEVLLQFRVYLKKNNMRYTPEREIVIRHILGTDRHINADDLFLELKHKRMGISRATVYRTLELLERCRFIMKADFGEKHHHYEETIKTSHHDHLICSECARVIEFEHNSIKSIYNKVKKDFGFIPHGRSFQIYGLCNECNRKETEDR